MKRYAANIITGCRIAFSILLLMFPVFSFRFYAMYLASGITDMIDGTVARKTNSASASGSRFDTIADAVFLVSALLKLLPEIEFPAWALTWIVVIAVIKQQLSHGGSFAKKGSLSNIHHYEQDHRCSTVSAAIDVQAGRNTIQCHCGVLYRNRCCHTRGILYQKRNPSLTFLCCKIQNKGQGVNPAARAVIALWGVVTALRSAFAARCAGRGSAPPAVLRRRFRRREAKPLPVNAS